MAVLTIIFSVVGITFSIVLEMPSLIGIWPAIGVAVGLAVGISVEAKYKKEGKIRPTTEAEKKKQKKAVVLALAAGIFMLLLLIGFFLFGHLFLERNY